MYYRLFFSICFINNCSNGESDNQTLMEIYDEMSRILATNLRACLKSLEVFRRYFNSSIYFSFIDWLHTLF